MGEKKMDPQTKKIIFIVGIVIDVVVTLALLVLSIMMVLPFWLSHRIVIFSDFSFHASRVEEIANNLSKGQFFTFIATKTFHHTGVASFLFYPTIFLYPWAIFSLFLKVVKWI